MFKTTLYTTFSRRLASLFTSNAAQCSSPPTPSTPPALPPPPLVAYCTDVEGDFEYWNRYVQLSKVLNRDATTGALQLKDGVHFVFGGDAVDQGPGDLRFLQDLLTLHRNHPGRVHVVLGNRDLNKMRLAQELSPQHCHAHPWKTYFGVFWRRDSGINHQEQDTLPTRLKWILKYTMGSERTFELRRQELALLQQSDSVTDDMVVESFIESLQPNGLLREYLKIGQIGVVLGDTLFVHGGLSSEVLGWVPRRADEHDNHEERVNEPNARTWIEKLNLFCSEQINLFCQDVDSPQSYAKTSGNSWAMQGGYGSQFGGGDLIQYGMGWLPDRSRNNTVIYRDWISKQAGPPLTALPPQDTNIAVPRLPGIQVVQYLNRANIRRVVCGHKPHGDVGLTVRSSASAASDDAAAAAAAAAALTVLTLDTSYSGQTKIMERDEKGIVSEICTGRLMEERRGCAVSELLIHFDAEPHEHREENVQNVQNATLTATTSRALIHGIDAFGDRYISESDDPSGLVGRISSHGGWTVKGTRSKDEKLILGRLVGWDSFNMYMDKDTFVEMERTAARTREQEEQERNKMDAACSPPNSRL